MDKSLQKAIAAIKAGNIIAYPTEAVYGLGCDPINQDAVHRLLKIKQRDISKGLILIAANFEQLKPFIDDLDKQTQQRVLPSWPGPSTWLLPARPNVPYWLTGAHKKIAVRITAHPIAAALCQILGGALISTSANPSDLAPARTRDEVLKYFDNEVDYIVEGTLGTLESPTEIRDGATGEIIRPG